MDTEIEGDHKNLGVHLNNKLDWSHNRCLVQQGPETIPPIEKTEVFSTGRWGHSSKKMRTWWWRCVFFFVFFLRMYPAVTLSDLPYILELPPGDKYFFFKLIELNLNNTFPTLHFRKRGTGAAHFKQFWFCGGGGTRLNIHPCHEVHKYKNAFKVFKLLSFSDIYSTLSMCLASFFRVNIWHCSLPDKELKVKRNIVLGNSEIIGVVFCLLHYAPVCQGNKDEYSSAPFT